MTDPAEIQLENTRARMLLRSANPEFPPTLRLFGRTWKRVDPAIAPRSFAYRYQRNQWTIRFTDAGVWMSLTIAGWSSPEVVRPTFDQALSRLRRVTRQIVDFALYPGRSNDG